jgi:Tol biopolymer transport system component
MVGTILVSLGSAETGMAGADPFDAIEIATGVPIDELSAAWHEAIRTQYGLEARGEAAGPPAGLTVIGSRTGGGSVNVGPALSPDGRRVAFLSERNLLSIDLYVADAQTGEVLTSLTRTAVDPHFESLQFLSSGGTWDPAGRRLAVGTVRGGRPVIAVFDVERGDIVQEIHLDSPGEIFQPAWSPDGNTLAFTAQVNGYTDLYFYDFKADTVRRVTNDAFADLQPAWSPDGRRLAFVTDRFSADLQTLDFNGYGLALLDPATGGITQVSTGLVGNVVNPQWSKDGALYFLSDASGRPEAYRASLEGGSPERFASVTTGITGITPLSPALAVAPSGRVAMTVFRDGGYELQLFDAARADVLASVPPVSTDLAELPPAKRAASVITQELRQPTLGLPAAQTFPSSEYSPGLSLLGIGQEVGLSTGDEYGTYVSGGVQLMFSDILGNHLLSTGGDFNGGLRDFSVQASYLNRTHRWNWGVYGERVPLISGLVRAGFGELDGNLVFIEQTERFKQTYQQFGAVVAYPFSRAMRVEFGAAGRHIGFHREIHELVFDVNSGGLISNERFELPAEPGLRFADVNTALVRDTAAFGATSPILGQRFRFDVTPTFGDLRMTTVVGDFRQYIMPVRPLTLVGRLLHAGRYGVSGEDQRLTSLFLGYSTLVRGYDVDSFDPAECTFTGDGSCPEFDRLLGSRIVVVNLEARGPLKGLFTGQLDYGPLPVELFTFFDAGVAWTRSEQPSFVNGGTRDWVSSAGFGARVNLFGFAIGEFNLARPLNRPLAGWQFVFNLRPGF